MSKMTLSQTFGALALVGVVGYSIDYVNVSNFPPEDGASFLIDHGYENVEGGERVIFSSAASTCGRNSVRRAYHVNGIGEDERIIVCYNSSRGVYAPVLPVIGGR